MSKKTEYENRVLLHMETVKQIMREAKADGLSLSVAAVLDVSGEPKVNVVVLMR